MKLSHLKLFLLHYISILLLPNQIECQSRNATLQLSTHDLVVVVAEKQQFTIQLDGQFNEEVEVTFKLSNDGLVYVIPNSVVLHPEQNHNASVIVTGQSPGHIELFASTTSLNIINSHEAFIRIIVAISLELVTISKIIGWCYFFQWSISFYLQIYTNYQRKSVVGLNFDYVSLNIVGYVLYSIFNIGLYFVPYIHDEYERRYPRGLVPAQLNDVFFATHATFATIIIITQCLTYERGNQRVSLTGRIITSVFLLTAISAILARNDIIHWLDFLYICSYIKLSVTITKYIPQLYMNYSRKSTAGWCIGNVLLDFSGGILSIVEMLMNAYNYDDWASIFGDPTKFGLGLFSVMFDILFMLQHYVFYRQPKFYHILRQSSDSKLTPKNFHVPKAVAIEFGKR